MLDGYPFRTAVQQGFAPLSGRTGHLQRCGIAELRGGKVHLAWQAVFRHRFPKSQRRIRVAQPLLQGKPVAKGHLADGKRFGYLQPVRGVHRLPVVDGSRSRVR